MNHSIRKQFVFVISIIFASQLVQAQVKTKIFDKGIPSGFITEKVASKYISITEPQGFNKQKEKTKSEGERAEYGNTFAMPKEVDIDFIREAAVKEEDGFLYYSLTLKPENALNLSLQFSKFFLSENAVLSLYTGHELTDSITAHENNDDMIWATRVYRSDYLNIYLKLPKKEAGISKLTVSKVNFGYAPFGADFFGSPGNAATCNINVLCPEGDGWENERKAVALLLVDDGQGTCTGTMVMNTCKSNIPYLLTANHCVKGSLRNWVFQFKYWSVQCAATTGWREDIQFNGCTLKSKRGASDFALVELTQVPPPNSDITYAGWNKSPVPAASTTGIHHPMADVMKISRDFHAPRAGSWLSSAAATHWGVVFDRGIVQFGSSGSPLFDQNHHIVGQLHGNDRNTCPPRNDNDCWCLNQIPDVGWAQYGRFDGSWNDGGQDTSRLKNWLDFTNTGAVTTNTTNVANLSNAFLGLQIKGPGEICSGGSDFVLVGAPASASITWTISDPSIATLSFNGTHAFVSQPGTQAHGELTVTATVNDVCYRNVIVSTVILIGGSYGNDFIINPPGNNGCYNRLVIYDMQAVPLNTQYNYALDWQWSYLKESRTEYTSWQSLPSNTPISQFSFIEDGEYQLRLTTTDVCGREFSTIKNITISGSCGRGNGGWLKILANPNPAKEKLTVQLNIADGQKIENEKAAIKIVDKLGVVYYKQNIILQKQSSIDINILNLKNGTYFIVVESASGIVSKQFFKTN